MKKRLAAFVAIALTGLSLTVTLTAAQAACDLPPNYKQQIHEFLIAKHPPDTEIAFTLSQPVRVLVGTEKKSMCALRCDWAPSVKGRPETRMLGAFRSVFLFEGAGLLGKMREASAKERLEWVDGEPADRTKKKG